MEGVADFYNRFNAIWRALVTCNNRAVKMNQPNVWNYRMPGKLTYRIVFVLFIFSGFWWIYNLLVAGSPSLQPCVEDTLFLRHSYDCTDIDNYGASIGYKYDTSKCTPGKVQDFWWYGTWNPFIPQGDEEVSLLTQGSTQTCTPAFTPTCTRPHARINQWRCFVNIPKFYPSKPPMYWLFVIAEVCWRLLRCTLCDTTAHAPTTRPFKGSEPALRRLFLPWSLASNAPWGAIFGSVEPSISREILA